MKKEFVICPTYKEACEISNKYNKPMYIVNGDENNFMVVDLSQASKLIKKGYKIADETSAIKNGNMDKYEKYSMHSTINKTHRIVKVLKEYTNRQEAADTLAKLIAGEIGEQELTDTE